MGELKKDYRISEGGLKRTNPTSIYEMNEYGDIYEETDKGVEYKNGHLIYDDNELDITIVWSDSITNAYKRKYVYHAQDLKPETLEAIYKDIVGEE